MSAVLDWLQAAGSFITMIFGMYGVGVKARDGAGRLTKEGRIVLVGIVLGGLVAISTAVWQTYTRQISAAAERARFSRLLESVERVTYATKDGHVSFEYEIKMEGPSFAGYMKRLQDTFDDRNRICGQIKDKNADVFPCGDFRWNISPLFDSDELIFDLKSSLAPSEKGEWIANQGIRHTGLWIGTYDKYYAKEWPDALRAMSIVAEDLKDRIEFSYDGKTLSGKVYRWPLSSLPSADIGVTSLSDLFGKILKVTGAYSRAACSITERERDGGCMVKIMNLSLAIKKFEIDFPHGVSVRLSSSSDQIRQEGFSYLAKSVPGDALGVSKVAP